MVITKKKVMDIEIKKVKIVTTLNHMCSLKELSNILQLAQKGVFKNKNSDEHMTGLNNMGDMDIRNHRSQNAEFV